MDWQLAKMTNSAAPARPALAEPDLNLCDECLPPRPGFKTPYPVVLTKAIDKQKVAWRKYLGPNKLGCSLESVQPSSPGIQRWTMWRSFEGEPHF